MGAATIRIFLADGTPHGVRIIEKTKWTGRGVEFARLDWPRARSRDDFAKPGVYVLTGQDDNGFLRVYIGEADHLGTRIGQHYSGPGAREFWTRAIAFSGGNASLNKAHVRHIEARLVALANQAKRCKVENSNQPAAPALSESDRAEAEAFLEDMLLIYPLVGIDAFTPAAPKAEGGQPLLHLNARKVTAQGRETAEGFVVLEGSRAAKDEVPSLHAYVRTLRTTLVGNGVLALDGDSYRVTQDYAFNSPSTAAAVLLGRTANGRIEWKDAAGTTLKAIQEAAGA